MKAFGAVAAFVSLAVFGGCAAKPAEKVHRVPPLPSLQMPAVQLAVRTPAPASVHALTVPGDLPAMVVEGAETASTDARAPKIVFLPGMCSNAAGYLWTFPEAARAAGGVLAIDGDEPCPGVKNFYTFSWDAEKQHRRIEAALARAGTANDAPITLIGYSQGAVFAEKLAAKYPERFRKIVLIGAPLDPVASHFAASEAFVTMSCALDVRARMKKAAQGVAARGVPATYVEMPGCAHGAVGDGEAKFAEVFAFLRQAPSTARF
jgi:pimeloyl-ACP methyl ester carboxylesterase